jgi:transcriptional regulator with XRE-family HTH domain
MVTMATKLATRLRLREVRQAQGFTQDGLARAARLSRGFVLRVENGKQVPGLEALDRLAAALRVKVRDLLDP